MPEKVPIPDQSHIPSANPSRNLLNNDVEIKGNIKFAGELTFDGRLEGDVQTEGVLNVGENAHITGNINAQTVIARGKINGNINAKDKIEIKARSELFGDIRAAKLVIEEGVIFVGKIEVNPNKVTPTAPNLRPPDGGARTIEPAKPVGR
jgi:cytoskeletal protein CcmA (bactofilin family)